MHLKNIPAIILLLLFIPMTVQSGAWVKPQGDYFFKLGFNYMKTDQEFNHKGEKIPYLGDSFVFSDTYFRDINVYLYYEYGVTNSITVWGDLAYKSYTSEQTISTSYATTKEIATTSGFADLRLLGVYGVMTEPVALSLAIGPKIPMGYSKTPSNDGPSLGTGEIDLEAYLTFGASFYPIPVYFSTAFGYRQRGGEIYHDDIYFNAEIGYTLGQFFFKAFLELIRNSREPEDLYGKTIITPIEGGGGVLPDINNGNQEISKILPSITYMFQDNIGIQAEFNHVFTGKNTLNGTTYSVGLVFQK